jgi:hypothetical protein
MFDLRSAHKPGLIAATLIVFVGILAFAYAGATTIDHPGVRYSHPPERVSAQRGRFYAGCVVAFGVALAFVSAYRPRQ